MAADSTTSTNIPIIVVDKQHYEYNESDKTLLNCLERHGIEVHFHCRDGFCGACRVTLERGQVCYPNGEPLAFVGENEILPCCCIPTSNVQLKIE